MTTPPTPRAESHPKPGEPRATASASSRADEPAPLERAAIELAPSARESDLEKNLFVRLREYGTDRPIEGASVTFLDAVRQSDALGRAFVPVPTSRERQRTWVCVEARGYFSEARVWVGIDHQLDFRLCREARLHLEVRDSHSGVPPQGAGVEIQQSGEDARGS